MIFLYIVPALLKITSFSKILVNNPTYFKTSHKFNIFSFFSSCCCGGQKQECRMKMCSRTTMLMASISHRFSHCIIIKTEIVRAVPGLGIFKHHTIAVVGLAADHCHAIIIICIHLQIFFINLCHLFYCHDSFAVYNRHA